MHFHVNYEPKQNLWNIKFINYTQIGCIRKPRNSKLTGVIFTITQYLLGQLCVVKQTVKVKAVDKVWEIQNS